MQDSYAGEILGYILYLIISLPPIWKILRRAGFSGEWSLIGLIPGGFLVAICILAFAQWPTIQKQQYMRTDS